MQRLTGHSLPGLQASPAPLLPPSTPGYARRPSSQDVWVPRQPLQSGAAPRESTGFGTGHHLLQNLPLPLTGCALGRVLAPHPSPQFLHAETRDGLPLPSPLGCSEDDS